MATEWTIETLKIHLDALRVESNLRYEQRFDAQQKAVEAALTSAKEAVDKAEVAIGERLKLLNEFRQQSADRDTNMVSRKELDQMAITQAAKDKAISEKVDALAARVEQIQGRGAGLNAGWGYLLGGIVLLSTIVTIALALWRQ